MATWMATTAMTATEAMGIDGTTAINSVAATGQYWQQWTAQPPQLVAVRVIVFVVMDNMGGGGGDMGVLMVGCLAEFVKEYCNQENIGVLGVLLLIVP